MNLALRLLVVGSFLAAVAPAAETSATQSTQPPAAPTAAPQPPPPPNPERVKDAGRTAINNAMMELVANLADGAAKRFAVLPVQGDLPGGYFTLQVRNLFSQRAAAKGLELYARDDAEWKALLDEIAWGQKFGDTMDAPTVQKFGKIRGVEGLIVGTLSSVSQGRDGEVRVRFNLQAFRVETGQILWSTEKSGVIAPPAAEQGPLALIQDSGFSKQAGLIAAGATLVLIALVWFLRRLRFAARPR